MAAAKNDPEGVNFRLGIDELGLLPKVGRSQEAIADEMGLARNDDLEWRKGRSWSLVYFANEEVLKVAKDAYVRFFSENGLSPSAFPSLRKFEAEVVSMTAGLLGGREPHGSMTSGGTESNFMAVLVAREQARARAPHLSAPQMVLPVTAHPSFHKAGHLFGVEPIIVPIDANFRADPNAVEDAVNERTILIVGSAPQYPHGVVDPIPEMAAIAQKRGINFHTDACLGGFFLPFLKKLGHDVPPFDLSVPGVTSIAADVHKFGYAAKGASVILHRSAELFRLQPYKLQWDTGLYTTPTLPGTRPGGAIAAAWAVLNFLGEDGYRNLVDKAMRVTKDLMNGINNIPGLFVRGSPVMSLFAYGSKELDIFAIADGLTDARWQANRLISPPSINLIVTPQHKSVVNEYLQDLTGITAKVRSGELKSRSREIRYVS